MWTAAPQNLTVTTTPGHLIPNTATSVTVTISNLPFKKQAIICLYKANDVFLTQLVSGNKFNYASYTFTNVDPTSVGFLNVTVTAHNYIPYMSTIPVVNCTYNSTPLTISSNTTWNTPQFITSSIIVNSGDTLSVNSTLALLDQATITVNGSLKVGTAGVITGYCDDNNSWGGTLLVNNGGIFEIRNGATYNHKSVTTLQVNSGGNAIIDAGGTLLYNWGAINLVGSNSVLNFTGNLSIGDNANFTFTGGGVVKFTSTANPSTNITAGTNSSITLQGSGQTQEILEIQQESMYPPSNLASFTLQNGKVVMYPSARINPNGLSTAITVNNILLTSNTGAFNSHRGLVLFGQPNAIIKNSIFQYGSYGIYAYLTYGGSSLSMRGCNFKYCDKGLFVHDKGVTLSTCGFAGNTTNTGYGLYAEAMAFSSMSILRHHGVINMVFISVEQRVQHLNFHILPFIVTKMMV